MKRLVALAALLLLPASANAAEGMRECAAAAEAGQLSRNSGRLVDAKRELLKCMKSCPRVVTNDCGQWLNDVVSRLPSIVLKAFDATGREITNVNVAIDGKRAAMGLDTHTIELDPGTHRILFEHKGSREVEEVVTVREGEKARPVEAHFTATADEKPLFPLASIVLAGVGVVGLGTFGVFHLSAKSDIDAMRDQCAPRCPESEVDDLDQKIFVANLALGIGLTALASAALVFVFDRTAIGSSPSSSASRNPFVVRF